MAFLQMHPSQTCSLAQPVFAPHCSSGPSTVSPQTARARERHVRLDADERATKRLRATVLPPMIILAFKRTRRAG
jgi:hypothetical protein